MEDNNIVKIEIRNGEFYDFFEYPPEHIHRFEGYEFMIVRKHPDNMNHDFLYIGTSNDLPKQLNKKKLKTFFEVNKATHILTFRVDAPDEMEMMKEEIIEKYPSIKQDLKIKKDKNVPVNGNKQLSNN